MTVYGGGRRGYPTNPASAKASTVGGPQQEEKRRRQRPRSREERTVVRLGNGLHISFHHHHRRGDTATTGEDEEGVYDLAKQLHAVVGHENPLNSRTETRRTASLRRSKRLEASAVSKQHTHRQNPPTKEITPSHMPSHSHSTDPSSSRRVEHRRRPSLTPDFSRRIPLHPPGLSGVGLWSAPYNRDNAAREPPRGEDAEEERPTNPSPIVTPNGGVKDLALPPETTMSRSRNRSCVDPLVESEEVHQLESIHTLCVGEIPQRRDVGLLGSLLAWTANWGWRRR